MRGRWIIAAKPNIKVTVDAICGHPAPGSFTGTQAYNSYFQNWPAWAQEGIVDMNLPMAYFNCDGSYAADFYGWLCFTRNNSFNRQNALTPGVYSASCLVEQLDATRNYYCPGAPPSNGVSIYSYYTLDSALYPTVRSVWTSPVSTPTMTWKTRPPKAISRAASCMAAAPG